MAGTSANRGVFVRAVGVLAMALMCAMAVAQVVHAHPENATTSRHACSICATAHAGLSVEAVAVTPTLVAAALTTPVPVSAAIYQPAPARFIRPPPTA